MKGRVVVVVAPREEPVTVVRASTDPGSQIQHVVVAPLNGLAEDGAPSSRRAILDSAMDGIQPPPPYQPAPISPTSIPSDPDSPCSLAARLAPDVEAIPVREPDPSAVPAKPTLRQTATAGAYARLKRRNHDDADSIAPDSDDCDESEPDDEVHARANEADALASRMEGSHLAPPTNGVHQEEEEEEDEPLPHGGLAAKVVRKDTLALRNVLNESVPKYALLGIVRVELGGVGSSERWIVCV